MSRIILLAAAVAAFAGPAFGQRAPSTPKVESAALVHCLHLAATALAIVSSEPAETIVNATRGKCSDKENDLIAAITRNAVPGASKIVDGTIAAMRRDLLATVLDIRTGVVAPRSLAPGPAAAGLDKIAEMAAFVREGSKVCPDADQWHVYQALALPLMIAPSVDEKAIAVKQAYLTELREWIGADRWCALYAANIDKAHVVVISVDPDAVSDEPRDPSAPIKPLNEVQRMQKPWIRPDPPADSRPGRRQYCLDPDLGEWKLDCTFLLDRLSLGPSSKPEVRCDSVGVAQMIVTDMFNNNPGTQKLGLTAEEVVLGGVLPDGSCLVEVHTNHGDAMKYKFQYNNGKATLDLLP